MRDTSHFLDQLEPSISVMIWTASRMTGAKHPIFLAQLRRARGPIVIIYRMPIFRNNAIVLTYWSGHAHKLQDPAHTDI